MTRVCTVCTHPDQKAIDEALVAGEPIRRIASHFGLVETSVRRHRTDHLPATLAKAKEAKTVAEADDLLAQARALRTRSMSLLLKAEADGDYRTALAGIREARGCLELLGRLLGELNEQPTVNLVLAPEWLHLRTTILTVLAPYPEARTALAHHLHTIAGNGHGR